MRIPLDGSAYVERSVIAGGQETINLFSESNEKDATAPAKITYYYTPGSTLFATPNAAGKNRGSYRTTIGTAYTVIGANVYLVTTNGNLVQIGTIANNQSQIIMSDNGLVCVLVDGTTTGYAIDLLTNQFAPITDPSFYGADYVTFLLTFFIFNRPKTNQFYISLSQVNFGMLTGTAIQSGAVNGGSGYVVGVYQNVPLTGGSGVGATANITVVNGAIATGAITAGSGYTNGTYKGVPLTGGVGGGAIADITVVGGHVTSVVFTNINDSAGQSYAVNNALTAANNLIGGTGAGFVFTISTVANGAVANVAIANPGQGYLISDVLSAAAANLGGGGSGFTYTLSTFALAFDPLDIAAKSGSADVIVAILAVHQELWLAGALTTEIWQGTGSADFFFQQVAGAYIEHGCIAKYSAANADVLAFWLSQDKQGKDIVVMGSGYDVSEISTPYLVNQFDQYATTDDAIGFCFQISDHAFYCLIFPGANVTWLYSLKAGKWFKWAWLNTTDGSLNRHRANSIMYFNEQIIVGDWENGKLYTLSVEVFTDAGVPIVRVKTFMHMLDNLDRVFYKNFVADVESGTADPAVVFNNEFNAPMIFLSWSDDRGKTFNQPIGQPFGLGGQTLTNVKWNRLGMARDRLFKLQWSENIKTALNGGFANVGKART
jgi:hypothetical protein